MSKIYRNNKLIATGSSSYNKLENKPKINGQELSGDKTSKDLNIAWIGTTAEYEALTTKNPNEVYIITDDFAVSSDSYYTRAEVDGLITVKQNRTDASLQTVAKNIVSAINELHTDVKAMSGAVSVEIVATKPTDIQTVVTPKILYVGTTNPYQIYLYTKNSSGTVIETSLGSSSIDLTDYQKKDWTNTKFTAQTIEGILTEIADSFILKSKILTAKSDTATDEQLYSAKYTNTLLQTFYDAIYPVGNIQFGFQQPNVPTGVTASWTDITASYDGRYLKLDKTNSVGTAQAEELPNIKGGGELSSFWYLADSGTSASQGAFRFQAASTGGVTDTAGGGRKWKQFGFDASKGQVNSSGSIMSSSVYKNGGAVRPLTTTIKIWKRES